VWAGGCKAEPGTGKHDSEKASQHPTYRFEQLEQLAVSHRADKDSVAVHAVSLLHVKCTTTHTTIRRFNQHEIEIRRDRITHTQVAPTQHRRELPVEESLYTQGSAAGIGHRHKTCNRSKWTLWASSLPCCADLGLHPLHPSATFKPIAPA
jgi:hypothetical protein